MYTTDHPFPGDDWLAHGGHHALDPLVALSFAAAATSTIRLHTNLFILAYRNPFLAAKGIATLDVLSGGRTVVGIGAGYLEPEFDALGVPFAERNDRMDEALAAMEAAWSGRERDLRGRRLPRPGQHHAAPAPPAAPAAPVGRREQSPGHPPRRGVGRRLVSVPQFRPIRRTHPHGAAGVGGGSGRSPRLCRGPTPRRWGGPSR